MAEKVKGLMVNLDKAKQGANKALFDFEAELKSLQSELDALEGTTTWMRTKLACLNTGSAVPYKRRRTAPPGARGKASGRADDRKN